MRGDRDHPIDEPTPRHPVEESRCAADWIQGEGAPVVPPAGRGWWRGGINPDCWRIDPCMLGAKNWWRGEGSAGWVYHVPALQEWGARRWNACDVRGVGVWCDEKRVQTCPAR